MVYRRLPLAAVLATLMAHISGVSQQMVICCCRTLLPLLLESVLPCCELSGGTPFVTCRAGPYVAQLYHESNLSTTTHFCSHLASPICREALPGQAAIGELRAATQAVQGRQDADAARVEEVKSDTAALRAAVQVRHLMCCLNAFSEPLGLSPLSVTCTLRNDVCQMVSTRHDATFLPDSAAHQWRRVPCPEGHVSLDLAVP